jgi:ubiquinone/menaquinone biosynthesis C-methylase UbiE
MSRPESIENRWDILYRDYPEVYEAFSNTPYHPTVYEQLHGIIDLRGKCIADVGAGTGTSSLALAQYARQVIGIEREAAMLRQARGAGTQRVTYLSGDALALPLADDSVDLVTGITLAVYPPEQYRNFIREGLRVAKGPVVYLGIPPGWYGGDMYEVIEDVEKVADKIADKVDHIFIEECKFAYQDIFSDQEYGTVEHIVSTYGFIFGKKAIEYLKRENKTTIRYKFRVYWRE